MRNMNYLVLKKLYIKNKDVTKVVSIAVFQFFDNEIFSIIGSESVFGSSTVRVLKDLQGAAFSDNQRLDVVFVLAVLQRLQGVEVKSRKASWETISFDSERIPVSFFAVFVVVDNCAGVICDGLALVAFK